jgi:hypothetical protein
MADYYPLISRAVAALEKNNGENRRALYERARGALLAQLRGITPSLSESDITRERLALEESIRKVEAEAARKFAEPSRQPPAPKIRPVEPRAQEPSASSAAPRRAPSSPASVAPRTSLRPEPRQPSRDVSEVAPRTDSRLQARTPSRRDSTTEPRPEARLPQETRQEGAPAVSPPSAIAKKPSPPESGEGEPAIERLAAGEAQPPRHPLRRPLGARLPLAGGDVKAAAAGAETLTREVEPPPSWPAPSLERAQRSQRQAVEERAELRTLERPEEQALEHAAPAQSRHDFHEPMLEPSYGLDEGHAEARPHELHPEEEADVEQPSFLSRIRELRPSPGLIKAAAAVVIACVVLGGLLWQWPNMVALYRSFRAPAVETASRETPAATARPKIVDRIEPGSQSTPLTPQAAAAVAQKVVLYEEDPADPNGKRFVGSAIWRTETVTPGPGQPPELAIRADVEVPERKLAMTWSLRRNTDKALPASHTVEIMFKLPTDFPSGGISNVPGILMKAAEQTRGVPLAGLAVKVTSGFFLIGLSSADADKERNVALLKERAWLDIPVVYNNNRRAILALEKGTPGERVFAEAFKVWKQ